MREDSAQNTTINYRSEKKLIAITLSPIATLNANPFENGTQVTPKKSNTEIHLRAPVEKLHALQPDA